MSRRPYDDYERARFRGFWRRVRSWLTGSSNELLPFDEVKKHVTIRGQRHVGLRQVPIDQIVGSVGRYRDFDRAFFPTQSETRDRWINISRARYDDVGLPPVELYQIGEIFFVKDGNHRVSVARERGQAFVDAYVTEIDVPVAVSKDTDLDELAIARERERFLARTRLDERRPDLEIVTSHRGQYDQIFDHVAAHRFFMGQRLDQTISFEDAAASWADEVYRPLVEIVREEGLVDAFSDATEADLYLWITRYQDFLRAAGRSGGDSTDREVARRLEESGLPLRVGRLVRLLGRPEIRRRLLDQRWALFLEQTGLRELRPDADLRATLPHAYETLSEHIALHRWYLGEREQRKIPYPDAVESWYDHVYRPLVEIVREQGILDALPDRTAADAYLWVQERRERLANEPDADPEGDDGLDSVDRVLRSLDEDRAEE